MIHLDTNFLIQALVPNSSAELNLQLWLTDGEDLGISSIVWSEFLCGPLTAQDEALAQVLFAEPETVPRIRCTEGGRTIQCDWPSFTQSRGLPDCRCGAALQRASGHRQSPGF